ncbi:MAG: hypothetical protein AAF149_19030 [Bacteroidota bacterium]
MWCKYGKAIAFHTYLAKLSAVALETLEEIALIFIYDTWVLDVKSIFLPKRLKR